MLLKERNFIDEKGCSATSLVAVNTKSIAPELHFPVDATKK